MIIFSPNLLKRLKKYWVEIIILVMATTIAIISLIIIIRQYNNPNHQTSNQSLVTSSIPSTDIYIDVSGAVKKPGLYKLKENSRLKQAIDMASNLDTNADVDYFYRNFNLARILTDQEKIYVPSIWEVDNNLFVENSRVLNYLNPVTSLSNIDLSANNSEAKDPIININESDIEELDTLPGVGKVTAQKIISGRPYTSIDELVTKKVISNSVYEKIKELIKIN